MKKTPVSRYHDHLALWKAFLSQGLQDDDWEWDWTTLGTLSTRKAQDQKIRAKVIAKSEGIWAGEGLVLALESLSLEKGGAIRVTGSARDGSVLKPGQVVCEWSGPARSILALERPFLNLASYIGGIATRTHRLVVEVKKAWASHHRSGLGHETNPPRVSATRKTLPGYRDLAVIGVLAGGGYSHRISLSGGVLIKENHIAAAGGIRKAIEGARSVAPHGLKIEIEVQNLKELSQALACRADVVLLDNFSSSLVVGALELVERAGSRPLVEVSGGISENNISNYVLPGVDVLSVGSLTHSVQAIDLSLLVK